MPLWGSSQISIQCVKHITKRAAAPLESLELETWTISNIKFIMASIAFPSLAKKKCLSDGTTYGYVASPPTGADKPTFLLLHGYPSSSYDWRHQIASLSGSGFGVIAPDLLGYGDTDSPSDVGAYRLKSMAGHMAEILDNEGVSRCVAVSHDWFVFILVQCPSACVTRLLYRFSSAKHVLQGIWSPISTHNLHTRALARCCLHLCRLRGARARLGHW